MIEPPPTFSLVRFCVVVAKGSDRAESDSRSRYDEPWCWCCLICCAECTVGHIIWARQIRRQLEDYLNKVGDVLGKGWENHKEGRALKVEGDAFRDKLNTQPLFDRWSGEVQLRQPVHHPPFF
jgi:hypothetical protein